MGKRSREDKRKGPDQKNHVKAEKSFENQAQNQNHSSFDGKNTRKEKK